MNDIFISYAREDKPWAKRLADALEARGWSVWWDAEIPPGETWDEVIERELTAAKAVVVLWSQAAVKKRWVKTEASLALDANKLLPVLIDAALPPIAFRPIQAASLADWRGDAEHEGFAQLLASIERLAGPPGGHPTAAPAPAPARAGTGAPTAAGQPPVRGTGRRSAADRHRCRRRRRGGGDRRHRDHWRRRARQVGSRRPAGATGSRFPLVVRHRRCPAAIRRRPSVC